MLHWLRTRLKKNKASKSMPAGNGVDYDELQRTIGYHFADPALLEQALKHRSALPALHQQRVDSNERLELLGDAVLGLIVTEHLFTIFPEKEEGELTAMKSLLVSRRILARIAANFRLGQFVLLSEAEEKSGGRNRNSIVADAFEALVSAIYLDGDLPAARKFVERFLLSQADGLLQEEQHKNFKSILLEYAQSRSKGAPFYYIRSEQGPDHRKVFTVEVRIQSEVVGIGQGNSKKRAEQKAAQNAILNLKI